MFTTSLPKCVKKERQRLKKEVRLPGIIITPNKQNLRHFFVLFEGPSDSPYQMGMFELELFLPKQYPMTPPKVHFLTKIYHPNVDKLGRISLSILGDKWTPALSLTKVCLYIHSKLRQPESQENDLNSSDTSEREKIAREWTKQFALCKLPVRNIEFILQHFTRSTNTIEGWISDFNKLIVNFLLLKRLQNKA